MASKQSDIKEIDIEALDLLVDRVQYAIDNDLSLSVEDMRLLLQAISTLCLLQHRLEDKDVTLHKLRKLLGMVQSSETRRSRKKKASGKKTGKHNKHSKDNGSNRNKASVTVEHHKAVDYEKGQCCPDCKIGKLYKYEPGQLLRITGHAPYEAIQHVTERFRCNACQEVYQATLPESVLADGEANQKYGYSARALMALNKFYSGLPYYHQGNLADIFGFSVSASTIFDQCEHVANAIMPIFYELKRQSANAQSFLFDDTHNRILQQQPELRTTADGKSQRLRKGVYSSGLMGILKTGDEVVLFETSLGHAGEHLNDILQQRDKALPAPLTMSDALSSNQVITIPTRAAFCNAHARRRFVDIEMLHPKDAEWVLDTYSTIWHSETIVREKKLAPEQRMAYHKQHSLPAMEKIHQWAVEQQKSSIFEEHGARGKAIAYFLRHFDKLTLFCKEPGALIDNNRMEEKIKIPIRGRKTAHFYKTAIGAQVANVIISVIATADNAGVNIYEYIIALQQNQKIIRDEPYNWLPWNYQDTLKKLISEKLKPDKKAA